MDAENLANESTKSPEREQNTDLDSGDPAILRDVGAKLEPEHSEFDDPGFGSIWVMPVGLGAFLAAVALVISIT